MSEYQIASKGSLKLKGGIKKKKKKDKNEFFEKLQKTVNEENKQEPKVQTKTKAEQAYIESQEKRKTDLILKKAMKSHKQRVEELNKKLDTMSEHFDIPKVSWTK